MNQQILVIDDSTTIHPLIKAILANEPVDIQSATDPRHGLVLAESMRPDLILLDVDMPEVNGFDVCQQLKSNVMTAVCPIMFLTSHSTIKEKVRGFELGAADYITKPFNRAELTGRVRASLRTSRVIRSLGAKVMVDSLTGLGNRAMFEQRLEAEVCLRDRFHSPLSIILLDVDHFKEINDAYGHPVGDQVLQLIGKIIADLCRREDVACRLGGDEFAIIAPHTPGADAMIFAERLGQMLAGARIKPEALLSPLLAGETIRVTASLGVAEGMALYDRSMVQRADAAMYRAKQQGRNRALLAGPAIGNDQT